MQYKRGLGVINFEMQNQALLMKNLDKFFNKKYIPWVHLVWEKHYRNDRLPSNVKKGSFWWRGTQTLAPLERHGTNASQNGQFCFF